LRQFFDDNGGAKPLLVSLARQLRFQSAWRTP
jgi:hypothetical protein